MASEFEGSVLLDGLDHRYHSLVLDLLNRDRWDRMEFDDLVRNHGLMPEAAFDVINEWADVRFGDLLIEEGDPLEINQGLVRERET